MKKVIALCILVLSFTIAGYSQEPTPTPVVSTQVNCVTQPEHPKCKPVTVTQGYVDDSTAAFRELVALRDYVQKSLKERDLTAAERKSYEAMKVALEDVIGIGNKLNAAHETLEKTYEKIIKIQDDLISKLNAQLNKKETKLSKILHFVEKAAILVAGIAIGRGIPL